MKRTPLLLLILLLIIAIAITALRVIATPASQPESNFAFRFEFGACNTDILDAFEGTFTQDRIIEPSITISLRLSEEQMVTIYQKMMGIDFFDYPDEFVISHPVGIQSPAKEYFITVRNGETAKNVHWIDDYFNPMDRRSVKLNALFRMIMEMIWEHPEFKKLPELNAGCL